MSAGSGRRSVAVSCQFTPAGTTLPRVFWSDFVRWTRESPVRTAGARDKGGDD
jgi:hypothetical protein